MAVNGILLGADTNSNKYLPLTGGTLTGVLTLKDAPTADLQAATKKYVDDKAPLIIDASSITSAEKMNSAIESINDAYQKREICLIGNNLDIYRIVSTGGTSAFFSRSDANSVSTAVLYKDNDSIFYQTQKISATRRTVTLSSTGWTASGDVYTQTATVSGVSATETAQEIHVTPATASMTAYMEAGVYASAQAANRITFTASEKPTADLTVYAVIRTL